ncbi:hypothetical protein RV10_GL003781 [Enterococcus pallens]|nr:hypothetical protein RV10_GL003781 [Enterococcus pallens]
MKNQFCVIKKQKEGQNLTKKSVVIIKAKNSENPYNFLFLLW